MTNEELAVAIEYARYNSIYSSTLSDIFKNHLICLLAIQKGRAINGETES